MARLPKAFLGRATALVLGCLLTGCNDERPKPTPPPPEPKAATCDAQAQVNDPKNLELFPPRASTFCLDPRGSDKGFGEGAKNPLDDICNLFDGECEVYKRFNVVRVVEAHYVDGGGSGATIDVYLSKFSTAEGAYGMFTKRVVGDGDPAEPAIYRNIAGGGAAALGVGNAYLWRGPHLVELTYNDTNASEAQIRGKADNLLPPLVKTMGEKLPGELDLPPAVKALPEDKRVPLGLRYIDDKLLDVEATGPAAVGYYRDGDKRWRVLAMVRSDDDHAGEALGLLGKIDGAAAEKNVGEKALRFLHPPKVAIAAEWLVAQKDALVLGVGDEIRVLRDGMSADDRKKVTLSLDEKRDLLRQLLEGKTAAAPAPSDAPPAPSASAAASATP
jgi:hypothetical protein